MSRLHYKYINQIDEGTVFRYSSQQDTLPATNIQNEILGKVWETEEGFIITLYNRNFPFRDTATTTVFNYAVPSGTYTGSGLASVIQSGLNTVGTFADHIASYDDSTDIFTIGRTSTSLGLFSMLFSEAAYKYNTLAVILGYDHGADKTGSPEYTSTATVGGEHEVIVAFSSTASMDSLIIHNHNFKTGTVIRMRGSKSTATIFSGGWNEDAAITLSSTVVYRSSLISIEFTSTLIKSFQLYFYDRDSETSRIGRIYAGTFFEQTYAQDNYISYSKKKRKRRSKQMQSESGATYFDKRDPIEEYAVPVPILDRYYDLVTKVGFETMLDNVGNDKCLWIIFDDEDLPEATVYGFFVGDTNYDRVRNTPTFQLKDLVFREQK